MEVEKEKEKMKKETHGIDFMYGNGTWAYCVPDAF